MAARNAQGGASRMPLVTVAGAMASGGSRDGRTTVEVIGDGWTEQYVDLRVHFGTPKLSKGGKSYVVSFGTVNTGDLKVNALAYIPIPKRDRRAVEVGQAEYERETGDRGR